MSGCDYEKKSFSTVGLGMDIKVGGLSEEESKRNKSELQGISDRVNQEIAGIKRSVKAKKIIPYGNRILVKRRGIGNKLGSGIIIASQETSERLTEIADVVYVPDQTFCDKRLLSDSEKIIDGLALKACEGNPSAAQALMDFNEYLRIKTLRPGDVLMVGKYVGTDFEIGETGEKLSMMTPDGIIGLVVEAA